MSNELRSELFFLIGQLDFESTAEECRIVRKASELYSLLLTLSPIRADSLLFRRNRLGLTQELFAAICSTSESRMEMYEQMGGPAWLGPILDVLEERKRDLDSPGWGR